MRDVNNFVFFNGDALLVVAETLLIRERRICFLRSSLRFTAMLNLSGKVTQIAVTFPVRYNHECYGNKSGHGHNIGHDRCHCTGHACGKVIFYPTVEVKYVSPVGAAGAYDNTC